MAWKEVYSTRVDSVDYENGTLKVRWKGGKTSAYAGVPPKLAAQVMNAPSVGTALQENVIGAYDHAYFNEETP